VVIYTLRESPLFHEGRRLSKNEFDSDTAGTGLPLGASRPPFSVSCADERIRYGRGVDSESTDGDATDAPALDKKLRVRLKAQAQRLDATLKVGKQGLSDPFLEAVRAAFRTQPLIKVRFTEFKDQRKALSRELAAKTDSALVNVLGHVATLYRAPDDAA
jgi:RNA-binding protein